MDEKINTGIRKETKFFNLDFIKDINTLLDLAHSRFQNRSWNLTITVFDDGDFQIELRSSWGRMTDTFVFQSSERTYQYYKEELESCNDDNKIVAEKIPKEEIEKTNPIEYLCRQYGYATVSAVAKKHDLNISTKHDMITGLMQKNNSNQTPIAQLEREINSFIEIPVKAEKMG